MMGGQEVACEVAASMAAGIEVEALLEATLVASKAEFLEGWVVSMEVVPKVPELMEVLTVVAVVAVAERVEGGVEKVVEEKYTKSSLGS